MAQEVADELIFGDGKSSYSAKKPTLWGSCTDVIKFSEYEEEDNQNDGGDEGGVASIQSCSEGKGEEDCREETDHEEHHNRHSIENVIIQVETFYPNTCSYDNDESVNDAFLYYSNDDSRLNTLKLRIDESEEDVTNAVIDQSQQQRKTKISFEISPLLMMADLLDEF